MTSTKKLTTLMTPAGAWDQVGEQWETLGKHVGTRLEKMRASASEDRLAFEHSVREMLTSIEDALGQAGAVVRDRKLHKDLAELRQRVHEAIQLTMDVAEKEVRDRLPSVPRRGAKPAKPVAAKPDTGPVTKGRRPATKKADSKKTTRATSTRARATSG